jgi:uncharacterized membrane protein YedE/YeeE
MVIENFTPVSAIVGGALIGLAATLLLWLNGRIAGISGILGGIVDPAPGDLAWRVLFLLGLVLGAGAHALVWPVAVEIDAALPLLVLGGLLVGFGTQLGSGCTSGHGVCGIARLSPRSIVATLVFMLAAGVTVYVMRHVLVR